MSHGTKPRPARGPATRITAEIAAAAGLALPGTLTVRAYACGKPGCRCHADPPRLHGPYAEWTRKIGGKTVTRRLTPAELAEYQPLFDNAKKAPRPARRTPGPHPRDHRGRQQPQRAVKPAEPEPHSSGKCGQSPLNLWAALQPGPVCPGQP